MKRNELPWRVLAPVALLLFGSASAALALLADQIGLGTGGAFGAKQTALVVVGSLGLLCGLVLSTSAGWRHVSGWRWQLRTSTSAVGILALAAWFGLLTGWGQATVLFVKKGFRGEIIRGIDYGWMVPAANLVLFLAVGLALYLVQRRWPRRLSMQTATFLLAWLAFLGLLLMIPRISDLAMFLLAAGIAFQFAWLAVRHWSGFSTLVRFSVGWPALLRKPVMAPSPPELETTTTPVSIPTRREFLIGAASGVVAVAVGTRAGLAVTERRALARLVRPSGSMPNVLLIVMDTVRAQSLNLYGYAQPTSPNLLRLAGQGILFNRAIAPAPWTLPSHASMFTGRNPHELSASWYNPLDATYPTLAEGLSAYGYSTAGFIANIEYCRREFGLARGFLHYEDWPVSPGQAFLYTSLGTKMFFDTALGKVLSTHENFGRKSAEQINRDFLSWQSSETQRPFFAFLNYFDAHAPYLPPAEFSKRFSPTRLRGFVEPNENGIPSPEKIRELNDAYDASIAYLDHHIGALFDQLARRGVLQNTLTIITSDHGEHFGDHGLQGHGSSLYRALLHVPLVVLFPSHIPEGVTVDVPVSLRNLPATVLDLLNLENRAGFPGKSLAGYWNSESNRGRSDETPFAEVNIEPRVELYGVRDRRGKHRSIVMENVHYIRNPDGREELYDWESDEWEERDLRNSPEAAVILPSLRAALEQVTAQV